MAVSFIEGLGNACWGRYSAWVTGETPEVPVQKDKPEAVVAPVQKTPTAASRACSLMNRVESYFNMAGSVPVLGATVAGFRCTAGTIQAMNGVASGVIGVIGSAFSDREEFKTGRKWGAKHALHGAFNQIRGACEVVSCGAILPAAVMLVHHSLVDESGFSPYLAYNENTSLEEDFHTAERLYNKMGAIPLVAIVSGLHRACLGVAQAVGALFIGMIGLIGKLFSDREVFNENISILTTHFYQGVLNTCRGIGECLAGATIIGSLLILLREKISGNNFDPVFKYNETA